MNFLHFKKMVKLGLGMEIGNFKILKLFPVLHNGWECDSKGAVIECETGERHVILTDYGSPYIASEDDLVLLVESYQEAIRETEEAMGLLHI